MPELSTQPQAQSSLTIADVLTVRALLSSSPALLPIELIDIIIDEANYWPHSTVEVEGRREVHGFTEGVGHSKIYLFTLPLAHPHTEGHHKAYPGRPATVHLSQDPDTRTTDDTGEGLRRGKHPCRRIVFELHSRDQGWSSFPEYHGTYGRSRSWFDVTIVRDLSSLPPSSCSLSHPPEAAPAPNFWHTPGAPDPAQERTVEGLSDRDLQRNVHAKKEETRHVVVWDWRDTIEEGSPEALEAETMGKGWRSMDGVFVRGLEYGDRVALWMHAHEIGWRCKVSKAIVTVYWAV